MTAGLRALPGAVRYELLRLRTLRSTWWLTVIALGAHTGIALLLARDLTGNAGPLDAAAAAEVLTGGSGVGTLPFAALIAGFVGVLALGQDHRHGLLAGTFTVVPSRVALVSAKAVVLGLWASLTALLALVAAYVTGAVVIGERWSVSVLSVGQTERALAGYIALVALTTLLGLALAAVFRHITAAAMVLIAVPLVIEPVTTVLLRLEALQAGAEAVRYLPFTAAARMAALTPDAPSSDLAEPLTPAGGAVTFGAYVAGMMLVTMLLVRLRDAGRGVVHDGGS